jgi:hypothetical protein
VCPRTKIFGPLACQWAPFSLSTRTGRVAEQALSHPTPFVSGEIGRK